MEIFLVGSEGISFYLKILSYVTSAFLDKQILPLERIYRIWWANFTLRYWRSWICEQEGYTLKDNFVSLNSYLCVEINAHALILILHELQIRQQPELFLPWLFSSQGCEAYFRESRSASSFECSQVNFTLKEFLTTRCKKVDAMLLITAKGMQEGLNFPRFRRPFDQTESPEKVFIPQNLPCIDLVEETVLRAKSDVEKELQKFGNFNKVLVIFWQKCNVIN